MKERDRPILSMLGRVSALAAVAIALAGCDSDPTEPAPDDVSTVLSITSMARTAAPATMDGSEPYEQSCPAGGRLIVEGEATYEFGADGSVHTWDQVMTHEDCGVVVDGREIVADGSMHIWGEARHGPVEGQHAPVTMQESFQQGTMTTTQGDRTVTCEYDLAHTFDPDANRYHVSGIACGRTVDLSLSPPAPSSS